MTTPSVDTLWAREGDMVRSSSEKAWSPFSSQRTASERSAARRAWHGFDFRVESENGTKRIVKTGGAQ